ncbi:MAG TPA: gpW family head-tail joining protein [Candidatus Binatia bacterium]|nr:gpW family head-tail joining protein [Candidatus Binatia bacterium]
MAWTQAEADQIRAAVLALATGTRVASVSYAGPPARTVSYQAADLPTLRALLAEMEQSLRTSTYRLAATRKGL